MDDRSSRENPKTSTRGPRHLNVPASSQLEPTVALASEPPGSAMADYLELTKPRITTMVVVTTAAGYVLAADPRQWVVFLHVAIGTALVASSASALNQVIERRTDAQMRRTANRPIPAGRLEVTQALLFAVFLGVLGMAYLAVLVNPLTAALGAATLGLYTFVYTPMKRRSSLATLVGAIPGAVPPMMGCTAATGSLDALAWVLFGILFLWQMPHFLAIAWLYRSDYARGGFPLLTLGGEIGGRSAEERTAQQMMLYSAALIPVSLLPTVLGTSGWPYLVGALLLGGVFLAYSFAFGLAPDARSARRLLLVSVMYLPLVLGLMVTDRLLW